jgi:hypothetical protein
MKTPKIISYKNSRKYKEKQERKEQKSKAREKARNREKGMRRNIVFRLYKVIVHHFPDLFEKMREIEDCRPKRKYELVELIVACIAMFLFKKGSRNAFNNECNEEKFKKNFRKIFKVRLPHTDTVDRVMRQLDEGQLEKLKTEMVIALIEKKVFYKYRLLDKYYGVAVDGSQVMNVEEGHCEHCLHRTTKSGKVIYFHNVLEAKLVCRNGFCISLATEWIENPDGDFDKQDCEQKAFARLAEKLKRDYPRLPICIVADALYPNQTFFGICERNGWAWMVTFKDGNLPTVWEEVLSLQKITSDNKRTRTMYQEGKKIGHTCTWINEIDYCGFKLNWFECVEQGDPTTSSRFVYISSVVIDYQTVFEMTESGRMRWKIENEGFNIQKNHGYGLEHQYSRCSMRATKNYYQCMQIAHMINQLFELSSLFKPLLKAKETVKHLWEVMLGQMRHNRLNIHALEILLKHKSQLRYE